MGLEKAIKLNNKTHRLLFCPLPVLLLLLLLPSTRPSGRTGLVESVEMFNYGLIGKAACLDLSDTDHVDAARWGGEGYNYLYRNKCLSSPLHITSVFKNLCYTTASGSESYSLHPLHLSESQVQRGPDSGPVQTSASGSSTHPTWALSDC